MSRPRNKRRADARAAAKLADEREKLSRLEPGGCAERPLEVEAASIVEARAQSLGCARCGGETRLLEHRAETVDGAALRVVDLQCRPCGAKRRVFVRLTRPN